MILALRRAGLIGALDEHFARALGRMAPGASASVLGAAAMASSLLESGHVCLELDGLAGRPVARARPEGEGDDGAGGRGEPRWPDLDEWRELLLGSGLVAAAKLQDGPAVAPDLPEVRPLVLDDGSRLYLYRMWRHERSLARGLRARLGDPPTEPDGVLLGEGLASLFGPPVGGGSGPSPGDGQRMAALLAVTGRLCVVTGGPGTGKTSTVVKLLALLQQQALARGRPLALDLLAPTGKAVARLSESIKSAKAGLTCDPAVLASIPEEAMTLHRFLGVGWGGPGRTAGGRSSPIPTDGVLVDEASMVDLAMMSRLLEALPPRARLILVGDREQLESVAPGSVLSDICNGGETRGYSRELVSRVERLTGDRLPSSPDPLPEGGMWDSVVHLTHSFRFGADSGVGRLARAVAAGDADAALALLDDERFGDVRCVEPGGVKGRDALVDEAVRVFGPLLRGGSAAELLAGLTRFGVLCATRVGPAGVEEVNLRIEEGLRGAGFIRGTGRSYPGRPILVRENSYRLKLWNGDVGILLDQEGLGLRACFVDPRGRSRLFAPARLPAHETAFATTVHKSQGSEADQVSLLLPEVSSRGLTRELLYTAVTRARETVTIYGGRKVLAEMIGRRVERSSGLRELLWGQASR